MSIYIKKNIIILEGIKYEKMYNSPSRHKYRVILSEDDYDYVENINLINRLDIVVRKISR
jgi:hypothetical protein